MEIARNTITKERIKASIAATHARRSSQICRVIELKISIRHNKKEVFSKLTDYFKQAKWVINDIIALSQNNNNISPFNYKYTEHKQITHFDKNKNPIKDTITLPTVFHRAIIAQKKTDILNLSKTKKKNNKTGKLKFKSETNCIPIITGYTKILDGCRITIPGFRKLRVHGINQLHKFEKFEIADAKLIRKASGYYIKISIMLQKEKRQQTYKNVGVDFGIKETITTSYGDTYKCNLRETDYLKFLSRKLNKRGVNKNAKKSKRYYKCKQQLKREYEALVNKRKDMANKIYHKLITNYDVIYFQDEQIKNWQKGLFGKQIQSSCLGSLKQRLVALEASGRSFKISKWEPTTKLCPVCGTINHPTLADRTYTCSCGYSINRDIHAARVILMIGSSKRAECLGQASAEGVATMPTNNSSAQANPLKRKQPTAIY